MEVSEELSLLKLTANTISQKDFLSPPMEEIWADTIAASCMYLSTGFKDLNDLDLKV
jgi:hypothetical protein